MSSSHAGSPRPDADPLFAPIPQRLNPGWRVAYEMRLKKRRLGRSWGQYVGPATPSAGETLTELPSLHLFRFWQVFDPAAAGGVGEETRQYAELICGPRYEPHAYTIHLSGAKIGIVFGGERATAELPSGERLQSDTEGAGFVLASNMVPQLAVAVRLLSDGGRRGFAGKIFSPDALRPVNYELTPTDTGFESSLGEVVEVDAGGDLVSLRIQEVKVTRKILALPRWSAAGANGLKSKKKPLHYEPPPDIRIHEVTVPCPDIEMMATLAAPVNRPAQAAAVFFAGSGRHDRHGFAGPIDIGTHELLDGLARRGLVSLRYDKRGAGETKLGKEFAEPSFEVLLNDARQAVATLRRQPETRRLPLFLIGHSQGGLVALSIAQGEPDIAGIALLAAAGRPLDAVLVDQVRDQAKALDLSREALEERLSDIYAFFHYLRYERDWDRPDVPGKIKAYKHLRRWYAEMLTHDPRALIARAPAPVLVMRGTADLQVLKADTEALAEAARSAGVEIEVAELKGLDHLLKRARGGGLKDYSDRRRRVANVAVDRIWRWIERHAR